MNTKLVLASVVVLVYCVSCAYSRDLLVEVISGTVRKKDTFSTDPYMSVSVCKQKETTPTVKDSLRPVWNWRHQFKNVRDDCRLKFHLYDEDVGPDDSIGEMETTVGKFIRERSETSTLTLGKKGDSNIQIRVRYVGL